MANELIVYLNGEFVKETEAKISVFDQGILFGDGKPGPITKKILKAFQEYARTHGTPIYKEEDNEK